MSLQIKLFVDWRGYQRGEIIEVSDNTGKALIQENIAEFYEKKKPIKAKQMKRAPQDKMLRGAPINKIIKK
jgi:hypothetical protein